MKAAAETENIAARPVDLLTEEEAYGELARRFESTVYALALARLRNPAEAVAHGLGLMAQDRRDSLIGDHSVEENVVLASLPALSPHGRRDVVVGWGGGGGQ